MPRTLIFELGDSLELSNEEISAYLKKAMEVAIVDYDEWENSGCTDGKEEMIEDCKDKWHAIGHGMELNKKSFHKKPYVAVHTHRHGVNTYHCMAEEEPSEEQMIKLFDIDFEPDREEEILITEIYMKEI